MQYLSMAAGFVLATVITLGAAGEPTIYCWQFAQANIHIVL